MDAFLRKQKPRPDTATSSPPPTLTEPPRAIVHPTAAAHLGTGNRSPPPRTPPPMTRTAGVSGTLSGASKQRKRFRKKVTGLFGDQTDLKKRMSKLLIDASADDLVVSVNNLPRAKASCPTSRDMASTLSGADGIVARLEEANALKDVRTGTVDDFDIPGFIATASRVLGSPEKLQTVRKTMGRLSPRSNDRFLTELELGTPPRLKSTHEERVPITPPTLPSVDSTQLDSERVWLSSPVSVERTGAPAVLRRKARRLDRGYRSADVLRTRLGEPPRGRKRFEGFEHELGDIRGKSRKNVKRELARVMDQGDVETDTDEDMISPERVPPGRKSRSLPANDPFQMLVEVAAVEQKSSISIAQANDFHLGQKRRGDSEEREKKRRRENHEAANA